MAKSQMFAMPMEIVFNNGGVFPIRRGHRDEEAFVTAHAVLARGGIVVMYCEGGRSRSGDLGEPKPGIGRLALESGVPVVPVALAGSESVRNWKRLHRFVYAGAILLFVHWALSAFDPTTAYIHLAILAALEAIRIVLQWRQRVT